MGARCDNAGGERKGPSPDAEGKFTVPGEEVTDDISPEESH